MQPYILIPLLPLLASIVLALAGRRLGEASHKVGIPAVVLSFGLSVAAFVEVLRSGPQSIPLYRLLESGSLSIDLAFFVDQLTVLLLLLVTGVSAVVHVYSSRYMIGDPRYSRFFAVMGLFTSAMITLVMSRNLLMTYMCWEAMGICSYLLISHWAQRNAAGKAATKAFLVNAVADVGFGLGVLLTFHTFGTLDIPQILERAPSISGQTINLLGWAGLQAPVQTTTLIALLLFMGALGKSAQVPFHVWLPFAMEAPTPVSALIHAATMVNAGPFLLVRFSPLLMLSPSAMGVIAVIGATTALFAAFVSMTQTDIKRLLAYSTISQIGFMIMTCGLGAFVAAVFHLMAHGFLKGFLFLSTGNALQAVTPHHNEATPAHDQERRTRTAFIGALIFSCIPALMLFSGPYEAMWTIHQTPAARIAFWVIALTTVFFTALYLFRGIASLFQNGLAVSGSIVRPKLFSIPHVRIVLAAAAVLLGFLFGFWSWFSEFLAPALGRPSAVSPEASWWLVLPVLAAVSGCGLAYRLHGRRGATAFAETGPAKSLYILFLNKFYFDEIYDRYVVGPNLRLARRLWDKVEVRVVDRMLNLLASSSVWMAGWLWRVLEGRVVDRVVNSTASASVHMAGWLWRVLEGRGVDRLVDGTASASVLTARWLWRVLEGRGIQGNVERLGRQADSVGRLFQRAEVHTLQEHLLLVVGGLVALLGLFYLLVFGG